MYILITKILRTLCSALPRPMNYSGWNSTLIDSFEANNTLVKQNKKSQMRAVYLSRLKHQLIVMLNCAAVISCYSSSDHFLRLAMFQRSGKKLKIFILLECWTTVAILITYFVHIVLLELGFDYLFNYFWRFLLFWFLFLHFVLIFKKNCRSLVSVDDFTLRLLKNRLE